MKYLILFTLISCGKIGIQLDKIEPVKFGPDFEKAIALCNDRYGKNTVESEQCFKDYRTYFSPKVGIDLVSVSSYCNAQYNNQIEVQACMNNLTKLITGK